MFHFPMGNALQTIQRIQRSFPTARLQNDPVLIYSFLQPHKRLWVEHLWEFFHDRSKFK